MLIGLVVFSVSTIVVCWAAYRLLVANGRLRLRVEELEERAGRLGLNAGEPPPGLPVGTRLLDFELDDLDGRPRRLSDWHGVPVLLVFLDPFCDASATLVERLATLAAEPAQPGLPHVVVVTRPPADATRELLGRHRVGVPALVQEDAEVAVMLRVPATPSGYLLDAGGVTRTELVCGVDSLLGLIGVAPVSAGPQATPIFAMPSGRQPLPRGARAPSFTLPRLGGGRVTLDGRCDRRLLLVFAGPECPACDDVLDAVDELHRALTMDVTLVWSGDAAAAQARVGEKRTTYPVALERGRAVSARYGMLSVPLAYVIDRGTVADIAIGREGVLGLARRLAGEGGGEGARHRTRPRRPIEAGPSDEHKEGGRHG